ncbi:putative deoxynucleotide monophosphate kinase [Bacillus phage BSP14]|nr:putative deoxynucleotide monophosphate kinase [Bacillus phage BSP14]
MSSLKIALCGGVRSGKSTVASYLSEKYKASIFSFATPLKKEFHKEYPHIPRYPKPVRGYQLYGQLKRYVHSEDIWVEKCFNAMRDCEVVVKQHLEFHKDSIPKDEQVFIPVIDDMRQPNEFAACKDAGFITIRIESSTLDRVERMEKEGDNFNEDDLQFETENHYMSFDVDYVINNDKGLEDLYVIVDRVMKDIKAS